MNIAHVLPNSIKFPLSVHNGRYQWVLQLASLQVSKGHEVTIYCNPSSYIENVKTSGIGAISEDKDLNNIQNFKLALENNHDIYHSHFDNLHFKVADLTQKQIVYTQHWWPVEDTIEIANKYKSKNIWAVPPTNYMYDFDIQNGINTKGVIYHGIDLDTFKPDHNAKQDKKRLLFASGINPQKCLDLAINVAMKSGVGLDIVGKITDKYSDYWNELSPLVDGEHIKYLGPKNHNELVKIYSSAIALIFPSNMNEAFGLVAIESQACGTPVIMRRGGSKGELIEEGLTGFLCNNESEFIEAIEKSRTLKSSDCINFASKFDVNKMADSYDDLYESLVQ